MNFLKKNIIYIILIVVLSAFALIKPLRDFVSEQIAMSPTVAKINNETMLPDDVLNIDLKGINTSSTNLKNLRRNIRRILSPQRVEVVRMNGNRIGEDVLNNTNTYLAAYGVILVGSFLLISIDGLSMTTNVSAVAACFNNIGPGFDVVGPTCNFSVYSWFSKLVLIFDMLAGRLEIFPMLVLFSRSTWRHK